jgi:hypothetical protein
MEAIQFRVDALHGGHALQLHGYLDAGKEKLAISTFIPSHCVASILIFNP